MSGSALLIMSRSSREARLSEYLRLAGVEVQRAESGLHALTQLERVLPDAVVCAAQLEDMSGRELMSILRSDDQFQQVVFLLLGALEDDEFGIRDAAVAGEASPAEVMQELRSVLAHGREPASTELAGNLEALGLDGALLALGHGRRSGTLRVECQSSCAELWLAQGQVVNARYGPLQGEAALLALLDGARVLLNADYRFNAQDQPDTPRVIDVPTRTLLQQPGPSGSVRSS